MAFATLIYVSYRKADYLICNIFDSFIGKQNIDSFSINVKETIELSTVNINSLPSALWVFSTAFLATHSKFKTKQTWYFWICIPLLYAISIEGIQLLGITDGTFDKVDVLYSIGGWTMAMLCAKFISIKADLFTIPYQYLSILYVALVLGNVW